MAEDRDDQVEVGGEGGVQSVEEAAGEDGVEEDGDEEGIAFCGGGSDVEGGEVDVGLREGVE